MYKPGQLIWYHFGQGAGDWFYMLVLAHVFGTEHLVFDPVLNRVNTCYLSPEHSSRHGPVQHRASPCEDLSRIIEFASIRSLSILNAEELLGDLRLHPVYAPRWYLSHPSGIQPRSICQYLGYNLGNAISCIIRWPYKDSIRSIMSAEVWLRAEKEYPLGRCLIAGNSIAAKTVSDLMLSVIAAEPEPTTAKALEAAHGYIRTGDVVFLDQALQHLAGIRSFLQSMEPTK